MFRSGLSYLAGTCWRRSITGSQGRSLHVSTCVELPAVRGLKERIANGETVLCAEGYLLALSRRGYIAHGVWVPECILEQPEVLRSVHEEFVHAGTDVVEAFQYYTHREKMKQIGREDDLERINRTALQIARECADKHGKLFAGSVCNTNIFIANDADSAGRVRAMYDEQVRWSKEEGADYIIAETLPYLGEAKIALDVIKYYKLPAVITMITPVGSDLLTLDGVYIADACKALLDEGATVVGLNCYAGPDVTFDAVKEIVKICPPAQVGALPIAYRTTFKNRTFMDLKDECCPENNPVYPRGMEPFCVSPVEITTFTKNCLDLGMKYLGVCCGNSGELTRAMAVAMGRTPPASRYYDDQKFGINPRERLKELTGQK